MTGRSPDAVAGSTPLPCRRHRETALKFPIVSISAQTKRPSIGNSKRFEPKGSDRAFASRGWPATLPLFRRPTMYGRCHTAGEKILIRGC